MTFKTKTTTATFILGFILSGCMPTKFSTSETSKPVIDSGTPVDEPPTDDTPPVEPPVVCDPFDPGSIVSSISGLKGSIHYLQAGQPTETSSTAVIANGTKVDADLFLNSVFVPTRIFNTGFPTSGGTTLQNENGDTLFEWFALNLKSNLKLGENEAEGEYQLAVLSDDGSTLSLNGSPFIENESTHPTRMACATTTISMTSSNRIPMNLSYFQGPREHISLMLMWRKVTPGSSLHEDECGSTGNEYFFEPGTNQTAAVIKAPYQGLLDRGWKPLSPDNYELQTGSNKCYQ
jgi:hypothetical protein